MKLLLLFIAVTVGTLLPAQAGDAPVSRPRAFLMSLVVPGSGELYCGARRTAVSFMAAEAGLWLSAIGFTSYRSWMREDARGFAALNAGVNSTAVGDDKDFYKIIGEWESVDEYNDYTEPGDATPAYSEQNRHGWFWGSGADREEYQVLRGRMIIAERRLNITLSVIAVNHLLSAVNTIRLSRPGAGGNARTVLLGSRYLRAQGCPVVTCTAMF